MQPLPSGPLYRYSTAVTWSILLSSFSVLHFLSPFFRNVLSALKSSKPWVMFVLLVEVFQGLACSAHGLELV